MTAKEIYQMMTFSRTAALRAVAFALVALALPSVAAPRVVRIGGQPGAWRMTVDGKPFVAKGAGGGGSKALLASLGANSFRTWGADDMEAQLDEGLRNGLLVTIGHWLHSTEYFSYEDKAKNEEQTAKILERVRRGKDHPALLMWALGNEMDSKKPLSRALWSYIDDLARRVKEIDPNHPVITVVMEAWPEKLALIDELCPHLDAIGINSYAGAQNLPKTLRDCHFGKPYFVTEFGPPLHGDHNKYWIGLTDYGPPYELSSSQKVAWYLRIASLPDGAEKGRCLGTYAFTWGYKVEATPTWFGLQLPDGTLTEAALALSEKAWGGHPRNHAPTLVPISEIYEAKLAAAKAEGKPQKDLDWLFETWPAMFLSNEKPAEGETATARVKARDPDGDALEYVWSVLPECSEYGVNNTGLAMPHAVDGAIVAGQGTPQATVKLPGGGKFRLYCHVYDLDARGKRKGSVAYANRPMLGSGAKAKIALAPAPMPCAVFRDGPTTPWIPSGWMGSNVSKLSIDEKCTESPHSGPTCMKVKWTDAGGWAGLNWQSPANDWGDAPGGANLSKARFLQFWARGYLGDEKVSFHIGGIGNDRAFPDSGKAERKDIVLTDQWKRYRIDLEGVDLSCIKTGFGFSFGGHGSVKTFFIDDVEYVAE